MKSNIKDTNRFFWKHIKKQWFHVAVWNLGVIVAVSISIIVPLYYKDFINILTSDNANMTVLVSILLTIMFLHIVRWMGWRLAEAMNRIAQPNAMRTIANESFYYLQKHSYGFFISNFSGALVKKVNRLVRGFEVITDKIIWDFQPIFIKLVVGLFILYQLHPILFLILLIWATAFMTVSYFFALYKIPFDNEVNAIESKMSGFISDVIVNNLNVTVFNKLNKEKRSFWKLSSLFSKKLMKSWRLDNFASAIQDLLMILIEFLIFYIGLKLWKQGILTIGDFVLIQAILIEIFIDIWNFGRYIRELGKGYSDSYEMMKILSTPHEIQDKKGAKRITVKNGNISFKNLNFGYEREKVLKNFNLDIKAGEKIALVSKSGGGKTTITKLLLRLYNVSEGSVFIDGNDIMKVTQNSLRETISIVPQDTILFHRTLAENISYGKIGASRKEIVSASKKAHCHEFIKKLPDGYDTFVGERGVKLSGGERQRVAIARAILENAPILILDEATSSLDSESETYIQDALKKLMKGKTVIVVAHRLSTIRQMDRIIVIENGKVTEEGIHEKLLKNSKSHYKMLWELQAGGFGK